VGFLFGTRDDLVVVSLIKEGGTAGMPDASRDLPEGSKACSHCGVVKPHIEFSKRSASKDGLSYTCKQCERIVAKQSYERLKASGGSPSRKGYYKRHREKHLVRCQNDYIKHREARLEQCRVYRQEHPEVGREAGARRRKRIRRARQVYSREAVIERDSVDGVPICQICMKPCGPEDLWLDHVIPLSAGGKDVLGNVRVTHKRCNLARPKDGRDLKRPRLVRK